MRYLRLELFIFRFLRFVLFEISKNVAFVFGHGFRPFGQLEGFRLYGVAKVSNQMSSKSSYCSLSLHFWVFSAVSTSSF